MLRCTDWHDLIKFAADGDEGITSIYVNAKHTAPDDQLYLAAIQVAPFGIPESYITAFLPDRDDTLMAVYTTKGTIVLDERYGFMRIGRVPMWNFIPAEA